MNPTRRQSGFTLMEVTIALGIMALVMVALYSTLNASLKTRDQIEVESRTVRLGPQILDLIEADLRRAWILNIDQDKVFLGESRTIDGEPADSISLVTNVHSSVTHRIGDNEVESDVCETGYKLRRNPDLPDVLQLCRRQSFHVDEEPLKDGTYEVLHDRVVRFQVRYRDKVDPYGQELQEWDSSKLHRLPALVEIELAIEAVPRTVADIGKQDAASRTQVYKRTIPLVDNSATLMRIHPVTPTFVAAGGVAGGSNLGSNQGGPGKHHNKNGGPDGGGGPNGDEQGGKFGGGKGQGGPQGGSDGGNPFGNFGGGSGSGGGGSLNFNDFLNQLLGGKGGK